MASTQDPALTSIATASDLCNDNLLIVAPRIQHEGKTVPSLGGIPLLRKLGQGGMAAVYYAIHPRLKKEVAVKVLPLHMVQQQPDLIDRFLREAQIAASVQSEHLVSVLDVHQDHGLFYLVMEFVQGRSAGDCLRAIKQNKQTGLAEAAALDICIAACEGLAAAHAKGVVHRDIKPDNILIPRTAGVPPASPRSAGILPAGPVIVPDARRNFYDRSGPWDITVRMYVSGETVIHSAWESTIQEKRPRVRESGAPSSKVIWRILKKSKE